MTPAQHKAQLRRVVKEWMQRLALTHIELQVEWDEEPEDPDAYASIHVSEYYDHAILRFADGWQEFEPFMLNRIVVHELLHIMFHEYGKAVRSIETTGALSLDLRTLWHDRCQDAEEGIIDRLANRFVELGGVVE